MSNKTLAWFPVYDRDDSVDRFQSVLAGYGVQVESIPGPLVPVLAKVTHVRYDVLVMNFERFPLDGASEDAGLAALVATAHRDEDVGLYVMRRIRDRSSANASTPLIVISSRFAGVATAKEALRAGANEYCVKPVAEQVLLHNILRYSGSK